MALRSDDRTTEKKTHYFCLKVCKLSDADENVVLILARCLPHIVPNVLLNKREVLCR